MRLLDLVLGLQLVSQSLRFISVAIRSGQHKRLFGAKETISSLIQGVVVPNVGLRRAITSYPLSRPAYNCLSPEHEIEQFEDDPLEYVRLDLSLPSVGAGGADTTTRRQAAADVLQALVSSGHESETTEIVGTWISTGLTEYNTNRTENWKAKDSAIYLLTAVATRGSTTLVRIDCKPTGCE
jgi:exportin-2 (importin alpha re-exporter)